MKKITKGKRVRVRFHSHVVSTIAIGRSKISTDTLTIDPHHAMIVMHNAKLVNDRRTALRIMEGEAKQVCAAIDCDYRHRWLA